MGRAGSSAREVVEPLDRLRTSIAEVVRLVKRAGGREYAQTAGTVEGVLGALNATAAALRARETAPTLAGAARLAAWLHDLRDPVTAMAGWAHILRRMDNEVKRRRARETIERNARLLARLLDQPPV